MVMRSGERCRCSRRRDNPENLWPLPPTLGESPRKAESRGGQRRSESKGAVTMNLQAAVIRNAGASHPGSRDPDPDAKPARVQRRVGRKARCRIPGREACGSETGRAERRVSDAGPQGLDRKVTPQGGCRVQPAVGTRKWSASWCVANGRNGEWSARACHRAGATMMQGGERESARLFCF